MAHRLAPASCLRQPSAAHPRAACAIPPHCRVLPARWVRGFVQPAQPSSPTGGIQTAENWIEDLQPSSPRRRGPSDLCVAFSGWSDPEAKSPGPRLRGDDGDWWWPAMRKEEASPAFAFATAFAERSHDLKAREGRRALGVWRKQHRDVLRSLVGAMEGGAERCARPPGHGGPRQSRRFKPDRHGGPRRSRRFKPDRHGGPAEADALASSQQVRWPFPKPALPLQARITALTRARAARNPGSRRNTAAEPPPRCGSRPGPTPVQSLRPVLHHR